MVNRTPGGADFQVRRAIPGFVLRMIIGILIAAPLYALGFTLYGCQGNLGCAAMALPDTVDSLLGRPVYPNFFTATGGPADNMPVILHPAPSLIHLLLLVVAIALVLETLNRRKARLNSN